MSRNIKGVLNFLYFSLSFPDVVAENENVGIKLQGVGHTLSIKKNGK